MTEPEGNISLLLSHTARGKQVHLSHRAPLGSRISHGVKNGSPRNPTRTALPRRTAPPHFHQSTTSGPLLRHRISLNSAALRSGLSAPHRPGAALTHASFAMGFFFLPLPPTPPRTSQRGAEHRRSPEGANDPLRNHFGARAGGFLPAHPAATQPPPSVRKKNAVK